MREGDRGARTKTRTRTRTDDGARAAVLAGERVGGAAGRGVGRRDGVELADAPSDVEPAEDIVSRIARQSWSPMKVITNDEYAKVLEEKVLKLEVEIAILDDKIAAVRDNARQQATESPKVDNSEWVRLA